VWRASRLSTARRAGSGADANLTHCRYGNAGLGGSIARASPGADRHLGLSDTIRSVRIGRASWRVGMTCTDRQDLAAENFCRWTLRSHHGPARRRIPTEVCARLCGLWQIRFRRELIVLPCESTVVVLFREKPRGGCRRRPQEIGRCACHPRRCRRTMRRVANLFAESKEALAARPQHVSCGVLKYPNIPS